MQIKLQVKIKLKLKLFKPTIHDKISWDALPKRAFFDILLTLKGEDKDKTFPPSPPPCNVVPMFALPVENNKHPNFEWRGGGGVWVRLLHFSTMS